ncbi:enoyl-CoA hydratase/isomerase family protein [bacterium]|jgi:enoyl-CoA hydratase/carnithine racemase|nr:enoyl-CoA hydratase/isomerase family protein [bacterium]
MALVDLEKKNNVYVVTLNDPASGNAINPESLSAHRIVLAELDMVTENAAVVVTSSDPKSWCVGLDFEWISGQSAGQFASSFKEFEEVFGRWALLALPTVGCVTGHCMAGGAIFASALDFRIMRQDRGWFAFTEIDVKIPLSPILYELADLLPNKQVVRELLLTGRRIGGADAKKMGVVDETHLPEKLMPRALEIAEGLAQKDLKTYDAMKQLIKQDLARQIKLELN